MEQRKLWTDRQCRRGCVLPTYGFLRAS